ncbi:tRNA threonylcarbamoyladenosine dehydratase [Akkermansiaceae bacterium]|nr:tRNA threonylcarbamoyladenosine dehydratase [Akkermansiaceae bacterium]
MSFSVPVTDEFLNRFGGIARLYGMPALEKFSQSHVMVIGLGGVGSWATEALARSGVGKLSLVDLDDLCWSNINRQIHALSETVGQQKSSALATRVLAINPEINVIEHSYFYSEKTADGLLEDQPDLIIDAFDTSKAKIHLIATCRDREIPVITSGAAGGRLDPTRVVIDDLSRAHGDSASSAVATASPKLRKRVASLVSPPSSPQSSLSTRNLMAPSQLSGLPNSPATADVTLATAQSLISPPPLEISPPDGHFSSSLSNQSTKKDDPHQRIAFQKK